MKELAPDLSLVGYCGVYCGACASYRRGKCPGCEENEKAGSCLIRACCDVNMFPTCASCTQYVDVRDCTKFNNFFSKLKGFMNRSDRHACVQQIREVGLERHAARMASLGRSVMRRR